MAQLFRPVRSNVQKQADILRDIQGKKAPLPVTGKPATKVIRAASPKQLLKQGASVKAIAGRQEQLRKERNK